MSYVLLAIVSTFACECFFTSLVTVIARHDHKQPMFFALSGKANIIIINKSTRENQTANGKHHIHH